MASLLKESAFGAPLRLSSVAKTGATCSKFRFDVTTRSGT